MGLNFRKSIKIGPAKVNLSKSGIGYSVGTKGLRVTKKAGGGTRTTASIPGTGISYSSSSKKKSSAKTQSNTSQKSGSWLRTLGIFLAVMFLIGLIREHPVFFGILAAVLVAAAVVLIVLKIKKNRQQQNPVLPAEPEVETLPAEKE